MWLSEIMLQQTRVEAVMGYYARFLAALPDISALAACQDDDLHKLWEGLGYYSRVRNLKKAAGVIMDCHGGKFPTEHTAVRALPGIGDYTAGAICSICFDLPTPAVDGNVLRLVARLTADSTPIDAPAFKRQVQQVLTGVYPARAGDFTQALMELGATLCGPNRKPECQACPCRDFCLAHARGTAEALPRKNPKRPRKEEYKTVFLLRLRRSLRAAKTAGNRTFGGSVAIAGSPGTLESTELSQALESVGMQLKQIHRQTDRIHIFTHIQWHMRGFFLDTDTCAPEYTWLTAEQICQEVALPTAYKQFWNLRISGIKEEQS